VSENWECFKGTDAGKNLIFSKNLCSGILSFATQNWFVGINKTGKKNASFI
jgi:hypothetical protein